MSGKQSREVRLDKAGQPSTTMWGKTKKSDIANITEKKKVSGSLQNMEKVSQGENRRE